MLTDALLRSLKPADRPYKRSDRHGLLVLVSPTGRLTWRLKYRFHGLERSISFGHYPQVTLRAARALAAQAREQLANGQDPMALRRAEQAAARLAQQTSFRATADEYIAKLAREGRAPATLSKARWFADLLDPAIGRRPIAQVTPHELLRALQRIEARRHYETARRLRAFASRVFRYAVATLRAESDPASVLRGALTIPKVRHHPAILDPQLVGALIRAIEGYSGRAQTRLGLLLLAHLFLRPGELRKGEWPEVDFVERIWRIPAHRMKMGRPHAVPLSRQVLSLLEELRALGHAGPYLFPAFHTSIRPMSENTLNAALRRLGYSGDEMTSHGFRATASTLLNESGRWHPDAIERALAHADSDNVRAAYHRGLHWDERVAMAQWWSDYLEHLRDRAAPAVQGEPTQGLLAFIEPPDHSGV